VVESDTTLAERLVTEGAAASLRVTTAADVSTAGRQAQHPDIVLLDPSFSDVAAEGLMLLTELTGRIPPFPVLILTAHNTFLI